MQTGSPICSAQQRCRRRGAGAHALVDLPIRLRDPHTSTHGLLLHVSATTARLAHLHCVAFLSGHALTRDAQRRSTRHRDAEHHHFPGALLTSAAVATSFSSARPLLNQLGTRVAHTHGAPSPLVDLVTSVLSSHKDSAVGVSCVAYPPCVAQLVTCRGRILLSSSSLPRRGIMLGTSVRKKLS